MCTVLRRSLRCAVVFVFSVIGSFAGSIELSLVPIDGSIKGAPGEVIGWGYRLVNSSPSEWFESTGLDAGGFSIGIAFALFDSPIVAPGTEVARPFDLSSGRGLYLLAIDFFAVPGAADTGDFVVNGQWWTGDPFGGGTLVGDGVATASYRAEVVGAPEPASLFLAGAGCLVLLRGRWRRKMACAVREVMI